MRSGCLDETQAAAFAADALPPARRRHVEDHADECASCRQVLAALVHTHALGTPGPHAGAGAGDEWDAGTRVGRYVVRGRIGRGGMGTVYRAEDVELGREVALKRLHAGADAEARARLVREARSAAQLQHPNVVTVHEVGEHAGTPFLAMELVDGTTLGAWLEAQPRTWREIVGVLAQAGRGLAAAHARGLVHRDFKPDNILIDRTGRARVADFGLARAGDEPRETPGPAPDARLARMTATGSLAGTPAYMAPELVAGAAPDARSDQYALAVTLHEALRGQHPFGGKTPETLWLAMAAGHVRDGGRSIPAWLDRHVRRGLAVDPARRWPDVGGFVAALERPRGRRWLALGGLALVVAAAVVPVAWWAQRDAAATCGDGAALVDELWSPAHRAAFVARFTALRPAAGTAIASAAAMVDDWTAAWKLGRRTSCAADAAQRPARLACLDDRLLDLRAQLAVWREADAAVADGIVAAAAALGSPDACAASRTAAHVEPALAARIAGVQALVRAGRARDAKPEALAVVAVAEASGSPAARAAALFASGRVMHALGDLAAARTQLARAASEAGAAADDATLIGALLLQATVVVDQGRPLDSLGLLEAAAALIARAGEHAAPAWRYQYENLHGDALTAAGRLPEALVVLRRAVTTLESRAAAEPGLRSYLATALSQLAYVHTLRFEFPEAHALHLRTLALEEVLYGRDHPEIGKLLHDLATVESRMGRYDEAVAHLQRARAIFVATYGEQHALVGGCHVSLATTAIDAGKLDIAAAEFLRGQAILTAVLPADHPHLALVEAGLGTIERERERCAAAIPHFERSLAILERIGRGGTDHATQMVNLGACQLDVGRTAEAKVTLTRGLAELDQTEIAEKEKAEARALLAQVAWDDKEYARAIAMAEHVLATTSDADGPAFQALRDYVREEQLAVWRRAVK